MKDIESVKRHLDEAIRVLTLESYRIYPDSNVWESDQNQCNIFVELNRVDCAIGPKGESMFGKLSQTALEAFTEIKLARKALD